MKGGSNTFSKSGPTMRGRARCLTQGAAIAALYAALTMLSGAVGMAGGPVQFRLSEALTVLPLFTGAAVPGLFLGCAAGNLLIGSPLWDVVFGSLATLGGAALTRKFRRVPMLGPVFPIMSNSLTVPLVLMYVYKIPGGYFCFFAAVFAGEAVCCGLLGTLLYRALRKTKIFEETAEE